MKVAAAARTTTTGMDSLAEVAERLAAMRARERSTYAIDPVHPCAIRWGWREKICRWCYQVVDNYDFDREVVSVAISHLDRFLAALWPAVDCRTFQLVAMTSLHLAIKLREPRKLSAGRVARLGRDAFDASDVSAMERTLLAALDWRVHPPTPRAFCRELLPLFAPPAAATDDDDDTRRWDVVDDLAMFLVELSVCDGWFAGRDASSVAVAAVLLALDLRGPRGRRPAGPHGAAKRGPGGGRARFLAGLAAVGMADVARDGSAGECYRRLRDVYRAAGFADDHQEEWAGADSAGDENDGAVENRPREFAAR